MGSGVAGALVASKLSRNGVKVLIVEAGPQNPSRQTMLNQYYSSTIKHINAPYSDHPQAPKPTTLNPDHYYIQTGPQKFLSTYERCIGGTTWHWLGSCLRLLPSDFTMKTQYNVAVDWPLSYKELDPWYETAESSLGVAGDSRYDLGSPRQRPYPKPPIKLSYLDRYLATKLKGKTYQGKKFEVAPNPQARDPQICQGSASCIPLCPTGAKYEAHTHIKDAVKHGAQILSSAVVEKIIVGKQQIVEGLEILRWDHSKLIVKGKTYFLAGGAIETAKVLLNSTSEHTPNGVANRSDQVGRNLMDHPVQLSWGLSPDPIYPYRGPGSTAGIDGFRDGSFRKHQGAARLEINNHGWAWPTGGVQADIRAFIRKGLLGKALRKTISRRGQREITLASLLEQLPYQHNRITLAKKQKDALGIPQPNIYYQIDDYERKGMAFAEKVRDVTLTTIGCTEINHGQTVYGAGHIMGTYRMGLHPKTSVVDPNLRSHDHPNLFLLGAGVFPTAGSANPTLTIAALSERCAAYFLANLS